MINCDAQWVYALIDPTAQHKSKQVSIPHYGIVYPGELFYVGRTKNLLDRYIQHMKESGDSKKNERISAILASGKLPIMITLHEACSEKEAAFREAYWTQYYLASGAPLTNNVLALNNQGYTGRESYYLDRWEREYYRPVWFFRRLIDRLFRRDDFDRTYGRFLGKEPIKRAHVSKQTGDLPVSSSFPIGNETRETIRRMKAKGLPDREIAAYVGLSGRNYGTYQAICKEEGIK